LVKLRDRRITKSTVAEMEQALVGDYRGEHLFVLRQSLESYRFHAGQMEKCDQQIETLLQGLAAQAQARLAASTPTPQEPPAGAAGDSSAPESLAAGPRRLRRPKRSQKPVRHQPPSSFRTYLQTICGVDLTAIIGLDMLSVAILISEIGTDMTRWRNAKAFCSWLGLCPGSKISGGKVLSSRTRRVVNRATTILRVGASTLTRSDCCLGHFYRRKKAHLGSSKAITATARKLACVVYHMLKYQHEYKEPDSVAYQAKVQKCRLASLRKQAAVLGFDLVTNSSATA
jgi:hypothetical protein